MNEIISFIKDDRICEIKNKAAFFDDHDFIHGFNLLHWSAFYNALDSADYLIQNIYNPDSRSLGIERSIVHPLNEDPVINSLLLNRSEQLEYVGSSPLIIACDRNHLKMAEFLINNKADINFRDNNDNTPLHRACYNGHLDIVKFLFSFNSCDINASDMDRWSALHFAASRGHAEIIKLLIDKKIDVNFKAKNLITPLMNCCRNNHYDCAEVLLKNNADINNQDEDGWTPILNASIYSPEILKILIDMGCDVNKGSKINLTPLMNAARYGNKEILKILLENNAEVNAIDKNGRNAFFWARLNGYHKIADILLDHGSKAITKDFNGINVEEIYYPGEILC